MKLYLKIFTAYFLLLGLGGYYLYNLSVQEIKPAMRQSTEEILVDISNLLAEIVKIEFSENDFTQSNFAYQFDNFLKRPLSAKIFSIDKSQSNLRIYITDKKGIVRYHSAKDSQKEISKDYSQWNDVHLTLQGKYGARSSEDIPGNPLTSVMYVAAPIFRNNEIIGVLSVGKPGVDIQPFINRSINNLKNQGLIILLTSVALGIILSYWLTRSIRGLTAYAKSVSEGKPSELPEIYDSELKLLGQSIEEMRIELEGKNYVEQYVHSLTHELKSPISAINGASELISKDMENADFEKLKKNIIHESDRLNDFVNRLLDLVKVEKISALENIEKIKLKDLLQELIQTKAPHATNKNIDLSFHCDTETLNGDRFLLKQCLDNLLQNAIDFSPPHSSINIATKNMGTFIEIGVFDQGEGIPAYAEDKIFERFYSLKRPNGASKSSGIGLSFVKQAVVLHRGEITVTNRKSGGVAAIIKIPKHIKNTPNTHSDFVH